MMCCRAEILAVAFLADGVGIVRMTRNSKTKKKTGNQRQCGSHLRRVSHYLFLFPATLHQQVVGAAGVGFQHAFHLELEEESGELANGNVGLHGDDVQLQVVDRAEQVDHLLLLGREVGEELALDAVGLGLLQLGVGLPTHGGHEVGGRGDEGGAVVAYQIVAAIAVGGAHVAGEG